MLRLAYRFRAYGTGVAELARAGFRILQFEAFYAEFLNRFEAHWVR